MNQRTVSASPHQPIFKLMFDNSKDFYPIKFKDWREAFKFGKHDRRAFSVFMNQYVVASWNPKDGFYSFVSPDLILQAELYANRKMEKDKRCGTVMQNTNHA